MRCSIILGGLLLATASPLIAQEATAPPAPLTVTGSITAITDYRFRGLSRSEGEPTAQGTINLNSSTGFYVGAWASGIGGSGRTPALSGHGNTEVDLYSGYSRTLRGVGVDAGLLYYYYPGRITGLKTDFFEPYASLSYTIGPVAAKVGANYAWGGQPGLISPRSTDASIYLYSEASAGIPTTPITLKAHAGHTAGSLGLVNPNTANDKYWDWSATAEGVGGPLKVGISYVDTNVTERAGFARRLGRGSTVLGYVGFVF